MPTKLIVIIGPNGVGKTTTASEFRHRTRNSAYVDADWCSCINPFRPLTEATKELVISNIFCLLRNSLVCPDIHTVVLPYSFHGGRKENFDSVIQRLQDEGVDFELKFIILKCAYEEDVRRARADKRYEERVQRGMKQTFSFYDAYECPMIDTTNMDPVQVVEQIKLILDL